MARIGCNVLNCSHNDAGVCYANRISITGKKAHTSNHTCCSSFLDQSTYSNLTSNTCTNAVSYTHLYTSWKYAVEHVYSSYYTFD